MKTILFSAVFGTGLHPERIRFLGEVLRSFSEPVRFVGFNASGVAEADFEMLNATARFKPQIPDPLASLHKLLQERCPLQADLLVEHVEGEFGLNPKLYAQSVYKHYRLVLEFERALERVKPDYVYLWNQFNALHRTFAELLKQRGIRFGFFHDGVLPGSIALDVDGEMGESWITRQPQHLLDVPIDEEDLARARAFIDGMSAEEMSRHPQTENVSVEEALAEAKLDDRPVVFFAGQNDWHAGIKPEGLDRVFHSHIFAGSAEALTALDRLAGDIGVTILFKPHPLSKERFAFLSAKDTPNSLILSSTSIQSCLERADLVATIASQTSYLAMITDKPVLMLGKNQMIGKGMTYDAQDEASIPGLIETGIMDPLKSGRREAFIRHVAQLERSYLFDYGTMETEFYRRNAAAAARYMALSMERSPEEVIDLQRRGEIL